MNEYDKNHLSVFGNFSILENIIPDKERHLYILKRIELYELKANINAELKKLTPEYDDDSDDLSVIQINKRKKLTNKKRNALFLRKERIEDEFKRRSSILNSAKNNLNRIFRNVAKDHMEMDFYMFILNKARDRYEIEAEQTIKKHNAQLELIEDNND